MLVVDGLGDLPIAALGDRTPLEAAETPVLDRLAGSGLYGLVDPIAPGQVPNTDSGVGMLLGLQPGQAELLRRGPIEAAGAGRPLAPGEIAVRANLASVERRDGRIWINDRRAGRITEDTAQLAAALDGLLLDDGLRADYRPTDQHRGVLVLSGEGLEAEVSDTDPGDSLAPGFMNECRPLAPGAQRAAAAINAFVAAAYRRLDDHPVNRARRRAGLPAANGIITRGAGAWFRPANRLSEAGLQGAVVAGCNTVLGLASVFGFSRLQRPGFTATLETDLEGKVATALSALDDHHLVFLHVKAPDICGHDRRPEAKCRFLQRLDQAIAPLAEAGNVLALTSDHTTDSNVGAHTADPVPSLLFDPQTSGGTRNVVSFGESACREGTMPRQRSHEFLGRVMAAMGA